MTCWLVEPASPWIGMEGGEQASWSSCILWTMTSPSCWGRNVVTTHGVQCFLYCVQVNLSDVISVAQQHGLLLLLKSGSKVHMHYFLSAVVKNCTFGLCSGCSFFLKRSGQTVSPFSTIRPQSADTLLSFSCWLTISFPELCFDCILIIPKFSDRKVSSFPILTVDL